VRGHELTTTWELDLDHLTIARFTELVVERNLEHTAYTSWATERMTLEGLLERTSRSGRSIRRYRGRDAAPLRSRSRRSPRRRRRVARTSRPGRRRVDSHASLFGRADGLEQTVKQPFGFSVN